ncbi:MAG: type III-B CRISPR module RAMP protein Cmr4 [Verrucomicrobiales bacterium]|nr:type III-B CRISPR module RAMP protein Cmr4 [Verrucomicrobiales bacterium]
MSNNVKRHLLTLYTRTPLHVGSGTSVDVVDLPIMRERITHFPVIPSTSFKGVLLQRGREVWPSTWTQPERPNERPKEILHQNNQLLFGAINSEGEGENKKQVSNAGCVQIMEAKLLAFPVRSLAGCFGWLSCPSALERFKRDTCRQLTIPPVDKDRVVAGAELVMNNQVVLEEYAMDLQPNSSGQAAPLANALSGLVSDPLWSGKLAARLALVHDENFQHFVTTCTELVARIVINPATRINENLFNQENVPCEALFYSVLTILPPRRNSGGADFDANSRLADLLPVQNPPILQIGGDETTGHGLCEIKREELR